MLMDGADFRAWFGKSQAVDAARQPLLVFTTHVGEFNGAQAPADASGLSFWAVEDVEPRESEGAQVIPAFLRIEKPFLDSAEDPFVDVSRIRRVLGDEHARRIVGKFASQIEDTGRWDEDYASRFASVHDLLAASEARDLDGLYFPAASFLADPREVELLRTAGFDGAIHGREAGGTEFKVFNANQVLPAIAAGWPLRPPPAPGRTLSRAEPAFSTVSKVRAAIAQLLGTPVGKLREGLGRVVVTTSAEVCGSLYSSRYLTVLQSLSRSDDFRAMLAERRQALDRAIAQIGAVEDCAIVRHEKRQQWVMILRDASVPGNWRTQMFDAAGFSGHMSFATKDLAVQEAAQMGYTQRDDQALDRLQDTESFQRGLYAADLIRRVNLGEISLQEVHRRLAVFDETSCALRSISHRNAAGMYSPASDTVYLMADRIEQGSEQAVYLHEIVHKRGRATLGPLGWGRLTGAVKRWAHAPSGTIEQAIHWAAHSRAFKAVGTSQGALYDEELFAYAVEEAVRRGVKPSAEANEGSAAAWLADVEATLRGVILQLSGPAGELSAQQMVDLAYALAQLENPDRADEVLSRLGPALTQQVCELADRAGRPLWYSPLQAQVAALPEQAHAPAHWLRWLAGLKRRGVSPLEIEWSGIGNWLAMQTGHVSSKDMLSFLGSNGVQLTEVVRGGAQRQATSEMDELVVQADALGYRVSREGPVVEAIVRRADGRRFVYDAGWDSFVQEQGEAQEGAEPQEFLNRGRIGGIAARLAQLSAQLEPGQQNALPQAPRYPRYVEPGGENYTELLLTLPVRRDVAYTRENVVPITQGGVVAQPELFWYFAVPGNVLQISKAKCPTQADALAYILEQKQPPAPLDKNYKSSHWNELNVVGHVRFTERTDLDGGRVIFIEEVQCDWAADARRNGFLDEVDPADVLQAEYRAWNAENGLQLGSADEHLSDPSLTPAQRDWLADFSRRWDEQVSPEGKVPRAPFVHSTEAWVALIVKRMVRYAADHRFDRVAFISGAQSVRRYGLEREVTSISWNRDQQGLYAIECDTEEGEPLVRKNMNDAALADWLGEQVARRIAAGEGRYAGDPVAATGRVRGSIRTPGLAVGGAGMRAFYDQVLPRIARQVVRKLGGAGLRRVRLPYMQSDRLLADAERMGMVLADIQDLAEASEYAADQVGFEINDAMRAAGEWGMPLFSEAAVEAVAALDGSDSPDLARAQRQCAEVLARHLGRPGWMRAPNGLPSKLTAEQWVMVRTENFRRWFGDWEAGGTRGMLDPQTGEPLVVHHGTDEHFNAFDFGFAGHFGVHVGTREQAQTFSAQPMQLFARVRNALRMPDQGTWSFEIIARWLRRAGVISPEEYERAWERPDQSAALREVLLAKGYDGIVYLNRGEGFEPGSREDAIANAETDEEFAAAVPEARDSFIVFEPTQLKSATGNKGIFSGENPDIRYSLAGVLPAAAQREQRARGELEFAEGSRAGGGKVQVDGRWRPVENALGQPIHPTLAGTINFWRWAGDTLVDEQGRPRVFFHGATADIAEFDLRRFGTNDHGWYGRGIYLTLDPATASAYTKYDNLKAGGKLDEEVVGGNVMPVYVCVRRPYVWPEGRKAALEPGEAQALTDELIAAGYDGVIVPNPHQDPQFQGFHEVIVFSPDQVKSAVGNLGEFARNNPDIRFSLAPEGDVSDVSPDTSRQILVDGQLRPTQNALGQPIHPTPQGQMNFWRWAPNTKAVDGQGRPLVGFHSTTADFHAFDVAKLGSNTNHSTARLGFFFSVDPRVADMFTEAWDMTQWPHKLQSALGARTLPVYLDIQNPKILSAAEFRELVARGGWGAQEEQAGMLQRMFGKDYDGILIKGDSALADSLGAAEWRADTWVAFRPEQITSAIGNSGRFDRQNLVSDDELRSPTATQPALSARRAVFFSQLERAINAAPDILETMPAAQWSLWVAANASKLGVKQEEIEWSGLTEHLAGRGEDKISRSELAAWIHEHGVQVHEVMKGGADSGTKQQALDRVRVDLDALGWGFDEEQMEFGRVHLIRKHDQELFEFLRDGSGRARLQQVDVPTNTIAQRRMVELAGRLADIAEDASTGDLDGDAPAGTRYGRYTLDGGENYRELLLTLPAERQWIDGSPVTKEDLRTREGRQAAYRVASYVGDVYVSDHWYEPNVLVHVRLTDRTDAEGRKVLFVEEIQSDWGQAGRKHGFKLTQAERDKLRPGSPEAIHALATGAAGSMVHTVDDGFGQPAQQVLMPAGIEDDTGVSSTSLLVPSAPFVGRTDAWVALAIKRVIKIAADEGYDRVAFVTGEQSAARYGLDKKTNSLEYKRRPEGRGELEAFDSAGERVISRFVSDGDLRGLLGPELARKLLAAEPMANRYTDAVSLCLHDLDVRVGGQGLMAFYDRVVPGVASKVLRKVGGDRLAQVRIARQSLDQISTLHHETEFAKLSDRAQARIKYLAAQNVLTQPGFDITPAMRDRVRGGVPLFSLAQPARDESAARWSNARVGEAFRALVEHARDDLEGVLMNWNDSGLNEDGDKIICYLGRDGRYTRGPDGGKSTIRKRDFFEWLASDEPFDPAVYDQESIAEGSEWRAEIKRLRDVARIGEVDPARQHAASAAIPRSTPAPAAASPSQERRQVWFGASQAVDRDTGQPKILYRGDRTPVHVFSRDQRREHGLFLAEEKERAAYYGEPAAVYARVERPLDLTDPYVTFAGGGVERQILQDLFDDYLADLHHPSTGEPYTVSDLLAGLEGGDLWSMDGTGGWTMDAWRALQRMAERNGFDGLKLYDSGEGVGRGVDWVVFEPNQVKSATHNSGEFSLLNPDIRFSLAQPQPQPQPQRDWAVAYQALRHWAGRSAVVVPGGAPLVVFHGTNRSINVFSERLRGFKTGGMDAKQAFFFAENPLAAEQFTWEGGERDGANIMPVYLRIERPLVVTDLVLDGSNGTLAGDILARARSEGYDGVIFERSDMLGHQGRCFAVFDPAQVKSATGNLGTYDPQCADIRFSVAGSPGRSTSWSRLPADPEFRTWFEGSAARTPMFHASCNSFERFDTSRGDLGAHFGTLEQAQAMAGRRLGDMFPNIIPAWLSIKRPLRLRDEGSFHADGVAPQLERLGLLPKGEGRRIASLCDKDWRMRKKYDPLMRQAIIRAGYDGVVYSNRHEGKGDSFIAFDPFQVRFALSDCQREVDRQGFRNWIAGTGVLDNRSGKPLMVFRGCRPGEALVGVPDVVSARTLEVLWATSSRDQAAYFEDGEIQHLYLRLLNPKVVREADRGSRSHASIVDEALSQVRAGAADWDGVVFPDTVDGMGVGDVFAVFPDSCGRVDHAARVVGLTRFDENGNAVQHGEAPEEGRWLDPMEQGAERETLEEAMYSLATAGGGDGSPDRPYDFSADPRFHHLFYGSPTAGEMREFATWLRERPNAFVRLYHGTPAANNIWDEGLLPASMRRRNSYQSSSGFVCLSVFPGMARDFGTFAALNRGPDARGNRVAVYPVTLTLRRLLADLDQLNNRRSVGDDVGNSLAESLVRGHGARVRGRIEPECLREPQLYRELSGRRSQEEEEPARERFERARVA